MVDFLKLVDISYWLNPGPGELSDAYLYFFIVFFGAFIIFKILFRYMGRQYVHGLHKAQQKVLHRVETLCLTLGVLGLVWVFLRYELVPFFSARFWLAAWFLVLVIWAYGIFHYARYRVQDIVHADRERDHRQKYFTRKTKR
ncbi:hypothetical protein HY623_02415 [Candidatus Uhrbacteria bacterium]|nr:hypothetical protein [Candidatus Uhrbacteria bacterium]